MADPEEILTAEVAQLRLDYDTADARLYTLEGTVEELETLISNSGAQPAEAKTPAEVELRYPDLESWVVEHFSLIYARQHGGAYRWCAAWWDHPEAIVRLESLWRSWEHLRTQPLGIELWCRERLDHHQPLLMGQAGPFAACTPDRHIPTTDLITRPAPDGWWDPPRANPPTP
ncbi:hypothetical protein Lfu02_14900 [Longispora fulva]|uniref:DUF4913 domain-containing protein n=1 Tax=Longispora fulva TaxID=619741 RepID=A0A8J7GMH6_9ACTN|nr:DUF4913 domain-containing protein [Longispora fulva]MBG6140500.1 hypothetical protein [Longispora fulva]GIG57118.1 hypothetical protein Lfu02_14900 [Longispora fulva]